AEIDARRDGTGLDRVEEAAHPSRGRTVRHVSGDVARLELVLARLVTEQVGGVLRNAHAVEDRHLPLPEEILEGRHPRREREGRLTPEGKRTGLGGGEGGGER